MKSIRQSPLYYLLGRTDIKSYRFLNKSDLNETEQELISIFRKLSDLKKERAIGFILGLSE